jgi:flagellar FliL protein
MTAPTPAPADAAPPPDAATSAAPAGGRSVPLALVLAVLGGLAIGLGAGFFAVGPALATGIAARHARAAKPAKAAHAAAGDDAAADDAGDDEALADDEEGGDAAEAKGGRGDKAAGAPVYTLTDLVLNPAESGGTRFLLLTIAFELTNQATHDAMKARDAELRDQILATIGNKTVDQLSNVAARDSLKGELRDVASKLFKKKAVRRVYFPQFVIQ